MGTLAVMHRGVPYSPWVGQSLTITNPPGGGGQSCVGGGARGHYQMAPRVRRSEIKFGARVRRRLLPRAQTVSCGRRGGYNERARGAAHQGTRLRRLRGEGAGARLSIGVGGTSALRGRARSIACEWGRFGVTRSSAPPRARRAIQLKAGGAVAPGRLQMLNIRVGRRWPALDGWDHRARTSSRS